MNSDPSPKTPKSQQNEYRVLPATATKPPTSPKPPPSSAAAAAAGWRRSVLVDNNTEPDTTPIRSDGIYNNVNRTKKDEISQDDEGESIEHEILDIVQQEQLKDQQRNTPPPPLPIKKRSAPIVQDNNLDIELEPTTKLIHPGIENLYSIY